MSTDEETALIAKVEALREQVKTANKKLDELQEEVKEYDGILTLMQKRELPWVDKWRKETGKHDTLPGYGEMLGWLCDRTEAADARVVELEGALFDVIRTRLG